MRTNILIGGKAGQGPNLLTHVLAEALVEKGYYVFYSRDYQSLIRGGHNFNILTISNSEVNSNDSKFDVVVSIDESTEKIHKKNIKKDGIIIGGKHSNMYFAGRLFRVLGLDFNLLGERIKKLSNYEKNLQECQKGFNDARRSIDLPKIKKKKFVFQNGNQGIAQGALASGIDIYYAYPMTPATPILSELAKDQVKNNVLVFELENELAVVNAGVGSAIAGAKTMIGTSGGGFDLMSEGLSLCGIAQVPLVFYLSQRPGPGTGVATYTAQGDLKIALNAGHGEFNRVVVAPGDVIESEELTNQTFYLSQKFKTPSIIVSDKHLGESFYTIDGKAKFVKVKHETKLKRWNSYETDSVGSATEDALQVKKNIEERQKVGKEIEKAVKKFKQYKIYGKKNSKNLIVSWGSTKGAILDSIKNLEVGFLQILYMKPFPKEVEKILKDKNLILIENNSTGLLGDVIRENTGINIEDKNKILRYDGRPFLRDGLEKEIGGMLG